MPSTLPSPFTSFAPLSEGIVESHRLSKISNAKFYRHRNIRAQPNRRHHGMVLVQDAFEVRRDGVLSDRAERNAKRHSFMTSTCSLRKAPKISPHTILMPSQMNESLLAQMYFSPRPPMPPYPNRILCYQDPFHKSQRSQFGAFEVLAHVFDGLNHLFNIQRISKDLEVDDKRSKWAGTTDVDTVTGKWLL
ncbi:hypothetical protein CC78DRAFT_579055 [Lojkania enalia]|uniref:Uncharacterized protein n=1 Tax=Lojkania enalia TaxID=147567 RepID=A0A9P4KD92_9PLEO|nr:hypothetical protein CC78DRAFT_579055 [Didymosphaeria enalia]